MGGCRGIGELPKIVLAPKTTEAKIVWGGEYPQNLQSSLQEHTCISFRVPLTSQVPTKHYAHFSDFWEETYFWHNVVLMFF